MNKLPKIKIFGIGSAGCHMIDRLLEKNYPSVEYFVVDYDSNSLLLSNCKNKIQIIGDRHFSGADYEYSKKVTLKNKNLIINAISGAEMIILVAGMGGGIGSAATSVVAEIAKESNILSVATVYTPFKFESDKRRSNTEKGLNSLKENANMTITIPNEKSIECLPENSPMSDAMRIADNIMADAINTIIAPIVTPSALNINYCDVVSVVSVSDNTFFGLGIGKGNERIIEALRYAINCPMSSTTLDNASRMIIYVEGGDDLTIEEVTTVENLLRATISNETTKIFFAVNKNSKIEGELKISILAATDFNIGILN